MKTMNSEIGASPRVSTAAVTATGGGGGFGVKPAGGR